MLETHGEAPDAVDLHDGRLKTIEVRAGGDIIVSFVHLVGYYRLQSDQYATYSHSGKLYFMGCSRLELAGALGEGDRISEGQLFEGDVEVEAADLLDKRQLSRASFILDSGSRMVITCREAQFTQLERGKRLRDWNGPLITE
jgi:hypothetical protein